ncbi:hypothetical protein PN36_33705 [Candidatus Thiomargarita nelsonii]|uniref:PIN domain-containing protein n=1 Tax=Candidatus Thiomargarita nelsonii TaxID=1003181 RepID=A0A4E0QK61_9GAMM|nr:hypothetical protein PN36_33705 [Candidatus Thiomargarita nelsonii]
MVFLISVIFVLQYHLVKFISDLTDVEVASAIARWTRMNETTEAEALAIQQKFAEHKALGYYTYQPFSILDFKQAKDWLLERKTALRTCDALHLAYAARLDAVLVTADKKLGQAAGDFGVRYQLLIARLH